MSNNLLINYPDQLNSTGVIIYFNQLPQHPTTEITHIIKKVETCSCVPLFLSSEMSIKVMMIAISAVVIFSACFIQILS